MWSPAARTYLERPRHGRWSRLARLNGCRAPVRHGEPAKRLRRSRAMGNRLNLAERPDDIVGEQPARKQVGSRRQPLSAASSAADAARIRQPARAWLPSIPATTDGTTRAFRRDFGGSRDIFLLSPPGEIRGGSRRCRRDEAAESPDDPTDERTCTRSHNRERIWP